MSRESLARAVNATNLEEHEERVTQVDQVHALGTVKGIGSDIIRFKDGMQPKSYKAVLYGIANRLTKESRINREMAIKVAALAIHESVFWFCPTCGGAKELIIGNMRVQCKPCEGVGVRRHNDRERAKHLGISVSAYQKGWEKHLSKAAAILSGNYMAAVSTANWKLKG